MVDVVADTTTTTTTTPCCRSTNYNCMMIAIIVCRSAQYQQTQYQQTQYQRTQYQQLGHSCRDCWHYVRKQQEQQQDKHNQS